jgi:hypothetical protein
MSLGPEQHEKRNYLFSARAVLLAVWPKIANVLAILSLIELTHQLVEWAAFIHEIAVRYAVVRNWMFSILPFTVPPGWHDYIVLCLIYLSVTNIGFYQRTGRMFFSRMLRQAAFEHYLRRHASRRLRLGGPLLFADIEKRDKSDEIVVLVSYIVGAIGLLGFFASIIYVNFFAPINERPFDARVALLWSGVTVLIASGALFAWRWILGTALVFGAIVAINEMYVHWMKVP